MQNNEEILNLELNHEDTVKVCLLYRDVYADLADSAAAFFRDSEAVLLQNPEVAKIMLPLLVEFSSKFRVRSTELADALEKISDEIIAKNQGGNK